MAANVHKNEWTCLRFCQRLIGILEGQCPCLLSSLPKLWETPLAACHHICHQTGTQQLALARLRLGVCLQFMLKFCMQEERSKQKMLCLPTLRSNCASKSCCPHTKPVCLSGCALIVFESKCVLHAIITTNAMEFKSKAMVSLFGFCLSPQLLHSL